MNCVKTCSDVGSNLPGLASRLVLFVCIPTLFLSCVTGLFCFLILLIVLLMIMICYLLFHCCFQYLFFHYYYWQHYWYQYLSFRCFCSVHPHLVFTVVGIINSFLVHLNNLIDTLKLAVDTRFRVTRVGQWGAGCWWRSQGAMQTDNTEQVPSRSPSPNDIPGKQVANRFRGLPTGCCG